MCDFAALAAEFPRASISWRPQGKVFNGSVLALAYIDARDVMDRLDAVCGPAGAKYDGREMGCAVIAARDDAGPLPGNPTRGMVAHASAILHTEARRCEANAALISLSPDLVTALRALRAEVFRLTAEANLAHAVADLRAATISDLTRERDEARDALAPFAEMASIFGPDWSGYDEIGAYSLDDDGHADTHLFDMGIGDLRRARAALSPTTKGGADA